MSSLSTLLITTENALNRANATKTVLANCSLRFVNNLTINGATNRAQLLAAECNFTGYPAGGFANLAVAGPGLDVNPGAILTLPSVSVAPASNNTIANNVTGGWYETSNGTTFGAFNIIPPKSVLNSTDQFPFQLQEREGLNG